MSQTRYQVSNKKLVHPFLPKATEPIVFDTTRILVLREEQRLNNGYVSISLKKLTSR
jgi:hypothetical protein